MLFAESWQIQLTNRVREKNTSRGQVDDDDIYIEVFYIHLVW